LSIAFRSLAAPVRRWLLGTLTCGVAFTVHAPFVAHATAPDQPETQPFADFNDQEFQVSSAPKPLSSVSVPMPKDLSKYIKNVNAAKVLGKALFWDMQVGSDGVQACATCHFRAGADPRSRNQLAPGGQNVTATTFELAPPNHQLTAADFPLHRLLDPSNRFSTVLRSVDDVVSSQGIKLAQFTGAPRGAPADQGTPVPDPVFNVHGANVRRVEPRNTPTVINAAFSRRSFWDGRADAIFNGVNEFGVRDPTARVVRADNPLDPRLVKVRIEPGAMASQAVAPVSSDLEMGFRGRTIRDAGRRLLDAIPLAKQKVAWDDSVFLGLAASTPGMQRNGLLLRYATLIQASFHPRWWNATRIVQVAADGTASIRPHPGRPLRADEYTVMEYNFPLFFGLAIQLYEDTLISDDAPIDRHFEGRPNALTPAQRRGLALFTSYTALRATAKAVAPILQKHDILVYEQGDGASRRVMVDQFRAADRAVMFGTKSFWEGVDIQGDRLSALAICKLPFDVPSDPIFAARSETFENAFNDYSVPETVLRFRQGFGRLIRSRTDRGVVAVFDKRLISKGYGEAFLKALPGPTTRRAPLSMLAKSVRDWLNE